jgi:DHA1 family multidrug resistance protein-like MFS transporter
MLLSGNFTYVLVLTVLFFALTSIMRPAINTLLSKSAGEEQGFVAGMNNAYMSLGNIFGPAIAGTLFEIHINAPYMLGAIVLLFSLYLSMSRGRRMKPGIALAK